MLRDPRPLVSIVIPAFNAEDYVKEAVDSALAQAYENFEVVVVDDGSTDGTKKVLEPYASSGKIDYVYQKNKGLAGARNTGIANSKGDYIALLDSDDIFLPEKVKEQVAALEAHPDFGACYCDIIHFTEDVPRQYYYHRYFYPSGNVFEPLLHRQFINPLSLMVRRSVIEKYGMFDENFRRSEDWELWLRWAHAGVKFYYLDKPLAHYRMRSIGNLSSAEFEPAMKEKNLEFFTHFGEKLTKEEKKRYNFEEIIKKLKIKTIFACLIIGDKGKALKMAREFPAIRLAIALLPASLWKFALVNLRILKHRLLLRKM